MNRIDRLFGILTILQSKKFVSASYLSDKFEISVRTVYRDIRALEELGIPVSFEQPKGYFIVQGYFSPPLSFTTAETNALILMASLSEKYADKSINKNCQNALAKLRAVLRYGDKEKAELITSNISVWTSDNEYSANEYISVIQKSIVEKTILEIEYTNNNNKISVRELEPIGLIFYSNQWHLIAWCWERKGYRDFKIKMISKLIETYNPFKKTEHFSVNQYIQQLN